MELRPPSRAPAWRREGGGGGSSLCMPGALRRRPSPPSALPRPRPPPTEPKFAVYDLVESKPPKNFFEAAEAGDCDMLIRMIERTLDFDINQRVRGGQAGC
jgi:hypothetical protein